MNTVDLKFLSYENSTLFYRIPHAFPSSSTSLSSPNPFLYLMPHTHFIITKPRWPGAHFRADTVTVIIVDIVCVISILHILSSLASSPDSASVHWAVGWVHSCVRFWC